MTALLITAALLSAAALLADAAVFLLTRTRCYRRAEDVPECDFMLVLGTAKYVGSPPVANRYYGNRIRAAETLWRQGRIGQIIVSGHGLNNSESETAHMQADLTAAGIPPEAVWQDRAGFRTLDSIIRCHRAFPDARFCIVSQPFHNRRALIQARAAGMNAVALHAEALGWRNGPRVMVRERFARLRLWYDLITRTRPSATLEQEPLRQMHGTARH
ncbi:vancomycin high temperature exclusion protein [Neisseria leonii]|uniref:SanA/YdcF family protein n=1 Tax=Neisseria leonii TaxID=2995413 RepID=UPI00237AF9E2|nr:ElyC/SanA/YdcF family protein [Neisseria sp. 3986]MDD9325164.1 YdcF family protein [Neisseria sp. 3986]